MISIKICGLCRPLDAEAALRSGADYLGVILSPGTRRSQSSAAAAEIFAAAPGVRRVGVFVDPCMDDVVAAVCELSLSVVQLHGQEPPEMAAALSTNGEVWKAVSVRLPEDMTNAAQTYRGVSALLFDAFHPNLAGGSGTCLDWSALVQQRRALPERLRVALAGGLTHHNVAEAIRVFAPQIVDVSSGVEHTLGEKNAELMQAFVAAARYASTVARE